MHLLLGLFFFSVLLTAGSSLQCEACLAVNGYCSGTKTECPPESVCMGLVLKYKEDTKDTIPRVILKGCSPNRECKHYEDLIGKEFPTVIAGAPMGVVITEATCSKAPPSFASFFPAFLGLLLMKLLFY